MKRYLAFAFLIYYPDGGWEDFVGSFGTIEEALAEVGEAQRFQIVDRDTGLIVDSTELREKEERKRVANRPFA